MYIYIYASYMNKYCTYIYKSLAVFSARIYIGDNLKYL